MRQLFIIFYMLIISSATYAQEIQTVKTDMLRIIPGASVPIQIDLNIASLLNPHCGLEVNFGDGNSQVVRAGINGIQDFPVKVNHVYATPGTFQVRVDGKTVVRGLRSAAACTGGAKMLSIIVVDEAAERAKADAAEKERELAIKQAELQRMAESIERERLEQNQREQKLRELDRKNRKVEAELSERRAKRTKDHLETKVLPKTGDPTAPSGGSNTSPQNKKVVDGF